MTSALSSEVLGVDYITISLPGKSPQQLDITRGELIDMPKNTTRQTIKDASGEIPRPPPHTLFAKDKMPEETGAKIDEASNLAGNIHFIQISPDVQTPKKHKKKSPKSQKSKRSSGSKDDSEDISRPPPHTLFTDDQAPEEISATNNDSNYTRNVYYTHMISEVQTPKKLVEEGSRSQKPKRFSESKDDSEDIPRPPPHTLFTDDQAPEETGAKNDESSNHAGNIFFTQMIPGVQTSKKHKKGSKNQKFKPASERSFSMTKSTDLGQQDNNSLISYSVQHNPSEPISIKLNKHFLSNPPSPPPKLVVERGFISVATYHPCPVECQPVSLGPQIDDPLLPIIFPFLYYNTGRTFASYDRDFLPWADPTKIRICTPKLVPAEPAMKLSLKKPSKWHKKERFGKRRNRK